MASKLPGKELPMTDYCAFSKDHTCIKWMDYELTRHELEEADELSTRLHRPVTSPSDREWNRDSI